MQFLDFELFSFLSFLGFLKARTSLFRSLECIFLCVFGKKNFENEFFFATPLAWFSNDLVARI